MELDIQILHFFQTIHNTMFDSIMVVLSLAGTAGIIWLLLIIIAFLMKKKQLGFVGLLALIIQMILGEILLKNIIQRTRPIHTEAFQYVEMLVSKPHSFSFPSGHTMSSFSVAVVFHRYLRKYSFWTFLLAALIGISRIYLCVHYPSDVLTGMLLGIVCGLATIQLFERNKHFVLFQRFDL